MIIGIWILAGGLAAITVIVLVITWFLCKKRIKERLSTGEDIRDGTQFCPELN